MRRQLPHERLIVYRKSIGIYSAARLLALPIRSSDWHLSDQLLRAASSISLNIAEGAGELSPREKARFFRIAIRSAAETAAAADLLATSGLVAPEACEKLKDQLEEVIAILIALCNKMRAS